jgi:hypothetical protein
VLWTPRTERKLASLWATSEDRRSIADAANKIDEALASNPLEVGESRSGNNRIIPEPPLGAIYRTREIDHLVLVTAIWRIMPRRQ